MTKNSLYLRSISLTFAFLCLFGALFALVPAHAEPTQKRLPKFDLPIGTMSDVITEFKKPARNWLPGHRGIDISGRVGQQVGSTASGVVSFAGVVAGKGVVTVKHGTVDTTYEPLEILVDVGQRVSRGEVIGRLAAGASHCAIPRVRCLHWGARVSGEYVNPLALVNPKYRLLPTHAGGPADKRS